MSNVWKPIALGAVIVSLFVGAFFLVVEFRKSTADYRGEAGVIEDTRANSDFRRQAYDGFFDLCASIQAKEATIESLEKERPNASGARQAQIDTNITALESTRARQITQYNADARKEWTRGPFLAEGLPYQIDIEEKTTCGN